MRLELPSGHVARFDEHDLPLIQAHKWRVKRERHFLYVVTMAKPRHQRMHRLIVGARPGQFVDHVNGDGLDNRRSNLRICTQTQNQQNRHHRVGVSPHKGVCWHGGTGRWQAQIKVGGRSLYLGLYDDPEDAARAYDAAAREYFGVFANVNFPEVTA